VEMGQDGTDLVVHQEALPPIDAVIEQCFRKSRVIPVIGLQTDGPSATVRKFVSRRHAME
jgi:hypothetical protein